VKLYIYGGPIESDPITPTNLTRINSNIILKSKFKSNSSLQKPT